MTTENLFKGYKADEHLLYQTAHSSHNLVSHTSLAMLVELAAKLKTVNQAMPVAGSSRGYVPDARFNTFMLLEAALDGCRKVKLDIDATVTESHKCEANLPETFRHVPMVGRPSETEQVVAVVFRTGSGLPIDAQASIDETQKSFRRVREAVKTLSSVPKPIEEIAP